MRTKLASRILIIAGFLILFLSFQNCSTNSSFESESSSSNEKSSGNSTIGGNGEPYGGKITRYQSYMEGFYCSTSDGQKIASPYSVVEKIGDTLKLVKEACEAKNEVLSSKLFIETQVNNTATFDFRRFYKDQDFINDVLLPKFNFDESLCAETMESRILRTYGTVNLTPEQMKTAKADYVEVKVFSMFYGQRFAEIQIVKNMPLIITYPDRNLVIEKFRLDALRADIQTDSVSYLSENSSDNFNMEIGRNINVPIGLKANYEGTISFSSASANLTNIRLSCPIYPHF